jgi:uncharacterized protein (TIGR03000 family)
MTKLGFGKRIAFFSSLAVVLAVTIVPAAYAGWGSWGSHGSWGGGSWGSGGSFGSHGSHGGPLRRLISRVRSHHASHGSWGGSHGSWGGSSGHYVSTHSSWGSGGGSYGGYVSRGSYGSAGYYGSAGSYYGGSAGTYGYPGYGYGVQQGYPVMGGSAPGEYAPVNIVPDFSAPQPANPQPDSSQPATGDAVLNLEVPESAKVYVNGRLTTTPGTRRSYVSKNLQYGRSYTYEVRAEWEVDGEVKTQTKVVTLTAGSHRDVAMNLDGKDLVTSLTLHVPDDAIVTLGGSPTTATGPVRVYATHELSAGQKWDDYLVSVTFQRDGRTVTEKRTVTLEAGQTAQLHIGTGDEIEVASR